jgi:hypothetical protein
MLLTNQCLDKIAAARVDFQLRGMLKGSCAFSYYNSFCMCFMCDFHLLLFIKSSVKKCFNPEDDNGTESDIDIDNHEAQRPENPNPFAKEADNYDDVEDNRVVDDEDIITNVNLACCARAYSNFLTTFEY